MGKIFPQPSPDAQSDTTVEVQLRDLRNAEMLFGLNHRIASLEKRAAFAEEQVLGYKIRDIRQEIATLEAALNPTEVKSL